MIEKFGTIFEATAFVEEKRAEGYFAEIMHQGTSFLWGPPTVGGFRVMVSDEKLTPEEIVEVEAEFSKESSGMSVIRNIFLIVLGFGIVSGIILSLINFRSTLSMITGIVIITAAVLIGGVFIALNSKSIDD